MDGQLSFRSYQEEAARTDRTPGTDQKALMIPLLGLAGEAGSLLAEYKKRLREGDRYKLFTDQVSEEIGDILWYLANIATKAGLDLQEIAEENLAKVVDRFSPQATHIAHLFRREDDRYDAAFPEKERLPLSVRVEFAEVMVDGTMKTELIYKGEKFGNQLTDNAHASDGYRFHDVFHWTIAVVLGWSPIVRRLLGSKRRSVHRYNEVEDGGRAAVAEEAISALIFAHARDHSFFDGVASVDYELLRAIKLITNPFEVRDRTFGDWEEAILKAYSVWRPMVVNNGGILAGEAEHRTVAYEAFPSTPKA